MTYQIPPDELAELLRQDAEERRRRNCPVDARRREKEKAEQERVQRLGRLADERKRQQAAAVDNQAGWDAYVDSRIANHWDAYLGEDGVMTVAIGEAIAQWTRRKVEPLQAEIATLQKTIAALERRIEALLPTKLPIAKEFVPGVVHYAGDVVTFRGGAF